MRLMHYNPPGNDLTNWEWCGTRMSLDSENTHIKEHVLCGRCLRKMKAPPRAPRKPKQTPISGSLVLLFDEGGFVKRAKITGTAAQQFWDELRSGKKGKKT